jgi:hypothetical protein
VVTDPSSPADQPGDGRRGNGLPSADWGALVDVDPRLSDGLLASLAAAGVPAYVEPAHGSHTLTRAATMPDRPLDRLWVDPGHADSAREVVGTEVAQLTALLAEQDPGATAHGLVQPVPRTAARRVLTPPSLPARPQPPAEQARLDDDAEFRRIIEGFSREDDSPVPPWPVVEDIDPPARRPFPRRPEAGGQPAGPTPPRPEPADEALPGWVEPDAVEDDGHYVPPPPPPVPRLAPSKLAAAAAVVVGVLLMFAPKLLLQDTTAFVMMLGVLFTAGGAAALIYLMRDAPPTDRGPDDGAVV